MVPTNNSATLRSIEQKVIGQADRIRTNPFLPARTRFSLQRLPVDYGGKRADIVNNLWATKTNR